jgi:hypothetical protein
MLNLRDRILFRMEVSWSNGVILSGRRRPLCVSDRTSYPELSTTDFSFRSADSVQFVLLGGDACSVSE